MFASKMSRSKAINSLIEISCFGISKQLSQSDMSNLISQIEKQFQDSDSYELEYWLGIALRNYAAWFIRGENRKHYLQKAAQHLEKAYALSNGVILDEIPMTEKHTFRSIDRNTIACEVGSLYIDEAIIRDIKKGISYLGAIFNNTTDYYPQFCSYAEAFYKCGDYFKAAEIALELHNRAKKSSEWKDSIPPAPMHLIAKSYRAAAKEKKKEGEIRKAISLFQKLVDMNLATENDKKLLKKLQVSL